MKKLFPTLGMLAEGRDALGIVFLRLNENKVAADFPHLSCLIVCLYPQTQVLVTANSLGDRRKLTILQARGSSRISIFTDFIGILLK